MCKNTKNKQKEMAKSSKLPISQSEPSSSNMINLNDDGDEGIRPEHIPRQFHKVRSSNVDESIDFDNKQQELWLFKLPKGVFQSQFFYSYLIIRILI